MNESNWSEFVDEASVKVARHTATYFGYLPKGKANLLAYLVYQYNCGLVTEAEFMDEARLVLTCNSRTWAFFFQFARRVYDASKGGETLPSPTFWQ